MKLKRTQLPTEFAGKLVRTAKLVITERLELSKIAQGEPWHEVGATGEPAFQNANANFGAPEETLAFYKDSFGVVRLKGSINPNGTTLVFTLPLGYWPAATLSFPAYSGNPALLGHITVGANGDVTVVTSNPQIITFNQISFRAA